MQKVFKYPVAETIELPAGAKITLVASQNGANFLWALINENAPTSIRKFKVLGTGQRVAPNMEFIASWQDRHYVWHLFEENLPPEPTKAEQAEIDQELSGTDPADHGEITPDEEESDDGVHKD